MALEKNKVHHIFIPVDTSVATWEDDLRNSIYAILIEEGWAKKDGEDFYSYPKDNRIKIQIGHNVPSYNNFWIVIRSYSSTGIYTEQVSAYLNPTSSQSGLFLNYIVNSKGEVGIGFSSWALNPHRDNFYFLIGLDKKNNAGVFIFPSNQTGGTTYCFMSLGEGIQSNSSRKACHLDFIPPFPHNFASTILYQCINYISGETFENIYGFYSAQQSGDSICESTFYIENAYYKGIGNINYNNWTAYDNVGNPTSLALTLGSAPKCLKLV